MPYSRYPRPRVVNAKRLSYIEAGVEASGVDNTPPPAANDLPPQDGPYDAHGHPFTNAADPVAPGDLATRRYVDQATAAIDIPPANELPAQTGAYDAHGHRYTGLGYPAAPTDAATAAYADAAATAARPAPGDGLTSTWDVRTVPGRTTLTGGAVDISPGYIPDVAHGGTGATSAAAARANLGITAAPPAGFVSVYKWGADF